MGRACQRVDNRVSIVLASCYYVLMSKLKVFLIIVAGYLFLGFLISGGWDGNSGGMPLSTYLIDKLYMIFLWPIALFIGGPFASG